MKQELIALSIVAITGLGMSWRWIRAGLAGPAAVFFLRIGHVKFAFWLRGLNIRKQK